LGRRWSSGDRGERDDDDAAAAPRPTANRPSLRYRNPQMIRSRARTGVASLFSLCYLLLEKSSKSLIPLSDCPFVLNRLPVVLENLPVSVEKTGIE
jgi:hypothetical protein